MNNQKLLKDSIENIKQLRDELHNDIDSSKRNKLDKIIHDLGCYENQQITAKQILALLGEAVSLLPAIATIIEFWDKL